MASKILLTLVKVAAYAVAGTITLVIVIIMVGGALMALWSWM
jgi:hypothetical protein